MKNHQLKNALILGSLLFVVFFTWASALGAFNEWLDRASNSVGVVFALGGLLSVLMVLVPKSSQLLENKWSRWLSIGLIITGLVGIVILLWQFFWPTNLDLTVNYDPDVREITQGYFSLSGTGKLDDTIEVTIDDKQYPVTKVGEDGEWLVPVYFAELGGHALVVRAFRPNNALRATSSFSLSVVPPNTPTPTPTPTLTPTSMATLSDIVASENGAAVALLPTNTPIPATLTPTPTDMPSATNTETPPPRATSTATPVPLSDLLVAIETFQQMERDAMRLPADMTRAGMANAANGHALDELESTTAMLQREDAYQVLEIEVSASELMQSEAPYQFIEQRQVRTLTTLRPASPQDKLLDKERCLVTVVYRLVQIDAVWIVNAQAEATPPDCES